MRRSVWPLLVLLAACATRPAPRGDTPEAYRAFLAEHPADPRADDVRGLLEDAEFARACTRHTVIAYRRFLEEFPRSLHVDAARERLEALRFNAAQDAVSLRAFLREHPDGAHRAEAEARLAELELQELKGTKDPVVLARHASGTGDPGTTRLAAAKLDDAKFERARAEGTRGLLRYLREHPAGTWREAAQRELFSRHLDGLLFSGAVLAAREEAGRNPLARTLGPELAARFAAAERALTLRAARRELQPEHHLRALPDVVKALSAPDPLDRWQAAEELGEFAHVDAVDPLLSATVQARNPEIRHQAFRSLQRILSALPPHVADHVLSTRLDALEANAATPDALLTVAVLHELADRPRDAARAYQQAFEPAAPDPLILRRLAALRLAAGQTFSAGVAARHLAVWAQATAEQEGGEGARLARARTLCAASRAARSAVELLTQVRSAPTEFPDDVARFVALAEDARRLVEARLRDAELALTLEDPHALPCADRRVAERLAAGVVARATALEHLGKKGGPQARALLELARSRDPDPAIRQQAAALLAGLMIR